MVNQLTYHDYLDDFQKMTFHVCACTVGSSTVSTGENN